MISDGIIKGFSNDAGEFRYEKAELLGISTFCNRAENGVKEVLVDLIWS